jgi:hypothetical protein
MQYFTDGAYDFKALSEREILQVLWIEYFTGKSFAFKILAGLRQIASP